MQLERARSFETSVTTSQQGIIPEGCTINLHRYPSDGTVSDVDLPSV